MRKTYEAMTLCDIQQLLRGNTKMTTQVYIYSPTEATGVGGEGRGLETAEVKWYANPAFHLPRLLYENERGNKI